MDYLNFDSVFQHQYEEEKYTLEDIKKAFNAGLIDMHDKLIQRDWRGRQLNTPTKEEGINALNEYIKTLKS